MVYFWVFYSVTLISVFVFMSILCYLIAVVRCGNLSSEIFQKLAKCSITIKKEFKQVSDFLHDSLLLIFKVVPIVREQ